MEAGEAVADYVAFGAFFPTTTKAVEHRADLDILTWWQGLFELPCVAIGGITPANAGSLVDAGADFPAVSGAVRQHTGGPAAAGRLSDEGRKHVGEGKGGAGPDDLGVRRSIKKKTNDKRASQI